MDSTRFDRMSRVIGEQTDRRGMLKVAAGSALALTGLAAFAGGTLANNKGYRGDDCSHNPDICKKGLRCNSDNKCEYKHKCGNKRRGKNGDDCKKNNDCCKKDDLICDNKKDRCERKK